jgi:hypothetical protein
MAGLTCRSHISAIPKYHSVIGVRSLLPFQEIGPSQWHDFGKAIQCSRKAARALANKGQGML